MKMLIVLLIAMLATFVSFAQKAKGNKNTARPTMTIQSNYRCPMHKEVVSDMAGTCAKCGKALVVVDRTGSKQGKTVYTCSMHPDEVRDKPGKCPKCGMALEKKKSVKSNPREDR